MPGSSALGWAVALGVVALTLISCSAPSQPAATATPGMSAATPPVPPNAEHNGRAWGPAGAPLNVLKFVDFQCPTCAQYASQYEPGIVDAFAATGKVRYEIRILTFIGPESFNAGMASLCAADQDAFWPMYHVLFANQPFDGRENTGLYTPQYLRSLAAQLGLDARVFGECLASNKHKATLDQDGADAKRYGVGRVPALVINGTLYDTARTTDDLRRIFGELAPAH